MMDTYSSLVDDSAQTDNTGSLLGSSVEIREGLDRVKKDLSNGPNYLKLLSVLVCGLALGLDAFSGFSDLVTIKWFKLILVAYAGFFAFIGLVLELNQVMCIGLRKWLFVWAKILATVSGRGWFYIICGGLHCSLRSTMGYVCGVLLIVLGLFNIIVSRMAGKKLNKLHDQMIQGHTEDLVYVRQVFNRFDRDGTGFLSSAELASACRELGTEFSTVELVAIFEYMDSDGDNRISYGDFERWWTGSLESINYANVAYY